MLLYAPELRLGSGLNPLPFFMYPSFFAAVIKSIFGLVFFCVVGIVLVRLSIIHIFIATYDLGLTDLTQLRDRGGARGGGGRFSNWLLVFFECSPIFQYFKRLLCGNGLLQ